MQKGSFEYMLHEENTHTNIRSSTNGTNSGSSDVAVVYIDDYLQLAVNDSNDGNIDNNNNNNNYLRIPDNTVVKKLLQYSHGLLGEHLKLILGSKNKNKSENITRCCTDSSDNSDIDTDTDTSTDIQQALSQFSPLPNANANGSISGIMHANAYIQKSLSMLAVDGCTSSISTNTSTSTSSNSNINSNNDQVQGIRESLSIIKTILSEMIRSFLFCPFVSNSNISINTNTNEFLSLKLASQLQMSHRHSYSQWSDWGTIVVPTDTTTNFDNITDHSSDQSGDHSNSNSNSNSSYRFSPSMFMEAYKLRFELHEYIANTQLFVTFMEAMYQEEKEKENENEREREKGKMRIEERERER